MQTKLQLPSVSSSVLKSLLPLMDVTVQVANTFVLLTMTIIVRDAHNVAAGNLIQALAITGRYRLQDGSIEAVSSLMCPF